ncbi:MAG TPA: 6-carboxytetrahydropterin synthase [Gemmatimonadaceae bacterium]
MPSASLTRRVTFAAAHRYYRSDWSAERNTEVFGAAANPSFHAHDYVCDVTVHGPINEITGMVVDLGALDSALQREVHDRFQGRDINLDVAEFADGRLVPTCENLALFIFERLQSALGKNVALTRVIVREDETLSAEVETGFRIQGSGGKGTRKDQ